VTSSRWLSVLAAAVLAALSQAALAEQDPARSAVVAWALPQGAATDAADRPAVGFSSAGSGTASGWPPAAAGLAARAGWKALDPDAAPPGPIAGGLAVETPSLLLVLAPGASTVSLISKAGGTRQELVLVGKEGRAPGGPAQVKLAEYSQAEAAVALSVAGVEARLKVGLGKPFVEVVPGPSAAALQVRSTARFAFIPDFFGNDVLYDATEVPPGKVYAPAENFLILLNDGGDWPPVADRRPATGLRRAARREPPAALTMLTWPKDGGEEVVLSPGGDGPGRRFAATQVSFNGKSVFVAVLARQGIWFGRDLAAAAKDKTFAVEGWRPPFPAKWMTILAKRPKAGAKAGLASETVEMKPLKAEGDQPYSDVYVHPWTPSWLAGAEWRLHLETELTHMMTHEKIRVPDYLLAIAYPRDRVKETPLDAFTLVDVMRGALGAGPCEYILDLEGLNKTRSTGAAGTGKPTAAATCSERGGLVYYYAGERSETPPRRDPLIDTNAALVSVEKIKDFLDAAHARIQEYLAWSDDLARQLEQAKAADPNAAELADRILPIAREMRTLWAKMIEHNKPCAFPAEWRRALDHCKDLIREGAPDLGARLRDFDPQMRGAGEEVDGGMQACRLIVKRIRQEAALAGSADPAVLKLAASVRDRCRDVLRNKHYKEGDSVRLSEGRAK